MYNIDDNSTSRIRLPAGAKSKNGVFACASVYVVIFITYASLWYISYVYNNISNISLSLNYLIIMIVMMAKKCYLLLQLNANGYVTCDGLYINSTAPAKLSEVGNKSVIAVFWSDSDGRQEGLVECTGDNLVYSHIYTRELTDGDEEVNTQAADIFKRAKADTLLVDKHLEVSWVLVVTWHKMVPWPYKSYGKKTEVRLPSACKCKFNIHVIWCNYYSFMLHVL